MGGNFLCNAGATLIVDGNTQSVGFTIMKPGVTLGGTGTLGRVLLDGTLSPGIAASPVGILTVTGNLLTGPTSTIRVDIAPGGVSVRVAVSGIALLSGTLHVVAGGATLPVNRPTFTVLQAGRVDNAFATDTGTRAYFDFAPSYAGNQVVLTTVQLPFADKSATQNKRNLPATATRIDSYVTAVGSVPGVTTVPPPTGTPPVAGLARNADLDHFAVALLGLSLA